MFIPIGIYILGTSYTKSTFRAIKRQLEPQQIERYGKRFEILFFMKGNIDYYKTVTDLKKEVQGLIKSKNQTYGYNNTKRNIIDKVNKNYILDNDNMKNNFLSEISKLNTPEKLSTYMKNHIRYGYIRRDTNEIETDDFKDLYCKYSLMSPQEVYETSVGICWDQTLFEKYVFDNVIKSYDYKIFFLQQENINESTHTFLAFTKNGKYYYFENAFQEFAGIKEFNSYDEIISYVAYNLRKVEGPDNGIYVNDLGKDYPKINSTCKEFYNFCIKKEEIKIIKN